MMGLFGWSFTQPVARSSSASTAIPTAPTCLPADISSGRTVMPVAPSIICFSPNASVTLKMRFVTASGRPLAVMGPADGRADSRTFVRTVRTGMISSCSDGPP